MRSLDDSLQIQEPQLSSGTLLREERYCLQTIVSRQEWRTGALETMWVAQDAQRGGSSVAICEVQVPECGLIELQSFLRRATIALTSIGRHVRIPMLWDVFSERTRHFFVFEPVDGESLAGRLRRTQQPLTEDEAIDYGIQIAETLDFLSQQSEPLVHGRIRPDYVVANRTATNYFLTNFSPLLAGGATQFVLGMPVTHLSPFVTPDFVQAPLDGRGDLYALLASMYYMLTGHIPRAGADGFPPSAQSLNPALSMECNAILKRGLHPQTAQRYQQVATLLTDLRALRSVREGRFQHSGSLASVQRLRQSGRGAEFAGQIEFSPTTISIQHSSVKPIEPVAPTDSYKKVLLSEAFHPQVQEISFWQKNASRLFLLCTAVALLVIVVVIVIHWLAGS